MRFAVARLQAWSEPLRSAAGSLTAHKLRSTLTILGVIIGVGTIIAMQAMVAGLKSSVTDELSMLGANTFQVQKYSAVTIGGAGQHRHDRDRPDLTLEHAEGIARRARRVQAVASEVYSWTGMIETRDAHTDPNVLIAGAEEPYAAANGIFVEHGRFISADDVRYHRRVVVLGPDVVERLFPHSDPLGSTVRVRARPHRVIGVLESRGGAFGRSKDNLVVVPITAFQDAFGDQRSVNITVQTATPAGIGAAQDEVVGILRALRRLAPGEPNDFAIWSSESLITEFNEMSAVIAAAALGIASISLLVAGIGIMNIMLVSVTERTREIGLRKALGATRAHLLRQFLIEAVVLTELGALVGIALGIAIALLVRSTTPLEAQVPLPWIPGAFGFCSVIGVVFGVYPAIKAAAQDPIEALHYE